MKNIFKYNLKLSLLALILAVTALSIGPDIVSTAKISKNDPIARSAVYLRTAHILMADGQETHGKNT